MFFLKTPLTSRPVNGLWYSGFSWNLVAKQSAYAGSYKASMPEDLNYDFDGQPSLLPVPKPLLGFADVVHARVQLKVLLVYCSQLF